MQAGRLRKIGTRIGPFPSKTHSAYPVIFFLLKTRKLNQHTLKHPCGGSEGKNNNFWLLWPFESISWLLVNWSPHTTTYSYTFSPSNIFNLLEAFKRVNIPEHGEFAALKDLNIESLRRWRVWASRACDVEALYTNIDSEKSNVLSA